MCIPKQVHKLVRREIAALSCDWQVVKKRDHYFLHVTGYRPICIGSNSSSENDNQVKRTLQSLRKVFK